MIILDFFKNYWTQVLFVISIIYGFIKIIKTQREATKCSLRNDILSIYEECKDTKEITLYQLQAIELSYTLYHKLNGNSFVDDIVKQVRNYRII